MTSSTSSRSAVASAKPRVPGTNCPEAVAPLLVPTCDRGDRPAGPAECDKRRPHRARADYPDHWRLARLRVLVRVGMVGTDAVRMDVVPIGALVTVVGWIRAVAMEALRR